VKLSAAAKKRIREKAAKGEHAVYLKWWSTTPGKLSVIEDNNKPNVRVVKSPPDKDAAGEAAKQKKAIAAPAAG